VFPFAGIIALSTSTSSEVGGFFTESRPGGSVGDHEFELRWESAMLLLGWTRDGLRHIPGPFVLCFACREGTSVVYTTSTYGE
jgi:hypothetical protein